MKTITAPYTFTKAGYFYFSRRIPRDLVSQYRSKRVVIALKTRSAHQARALAGANAAKLEAHWVQLRLASSDIPGLHLVKSGVRSNSAYSLVNTVEPISEDQTTPLDALQIYLSHKAKGRPKTFTAAAERSTAYVIKVAGNKALQEYTRADALKFRDWLVAKGLAGSSVTRNFSHIKAIINFACSELAIEMRNPFSGVFHDRTAGVVARKPIPIENIRNIQKACRDIDDDMRWLVALISDSGMRLAEAAGLLKSDIILDHDTPYVRLIKHPWRNLKTQSSQRLIPLVGDSLWAAERLLEADTASQFAFPRYNRQTTTSANAASAALNKWLSPYVPEGCTMHSFRHSFRDRLRQIECPTEIADQLGGWASHSVGQGYGEGYSLGVLKSWLQSFAY